jgi:hypothetical protein
VSNFTLYSALGVVTTIVLGALPREALARMQPIVARLDVRLLPLPSLHRIRINDCRNTSANRASVSAVLFASWHSVEFQTLTRNFEASIGDIHAYDLAKRLLVQQHPQELYFSAAQIQDTFHFC